MKECCENCKRSTYSEEFLCRGIKYLMCTTGFYEGGCVLEKDWCSFYEAKAREAT